MSSAKAKSKDTKKKVLDEKDEITLRKTDIVLFKWMYGILKKEVTGGLSKEVIAAFNNCIDVCTKYEDDLRINTARFRNKYTSMHYLKMFSYERQTHVKDEEKDWYGFPGYFEHEDRGYTDRPKVTSKYTQEEYNAMRKEILKHYKILYDCIRDDVKRIYEHYKAVEIAKQDIRILNGKIRTHKKRIEKALHQIDAYTGSIATFEMQLEDAKKHYETVVKK